MRLRCSMRILYPVWLGVNNMTWPGVRGRAARPWRPALWTSCRRTWSSRSTRRWARPSPTPPSTNSAPPSHGSSKPTRPAHDIPVRTNTQTALALMFLEDVNAGTAITYGVSASCLLLCQITSYVTFGLWYSVTPLRKLHIRYRYLMLVSVAHSFLAIKSAQV